MTAVVLVAASGLAREVAETIRAAGDCEVAGVLDDDPALHGCVVGGLDVLGGIDDAPRHLGKRFLICAGKGSARQGIAQRLERLGVGADQYHTVVHPSVQVPGSCTVGRGSILLSGTVLTADVQIGRHVVVMPNAVLTHDNVLADHVTVCAGVVLGGWVEVGARAYLGMAASIRERTRIGADVILGMGAVVLGDIPDAETWVGVPARPLP